VDVPPRRILDTPVNDHILGDATCTHGSNPARFSQARWYPFARAEIFALPIPKARQPIVENWTIFRTAIGDSTPRPRKKPPGTQHALFEERIMNYAQFHALYDALKERVGSVRKPRTR
jgi:hypothetical protein